MTLAQQINAIHECNTLDDIKLSYDALHDLMRQFNNTTDLSHKLVNYQNVAFLAHTLNTRALEVIGNIYDAGINAVNDAIKQHFKLYVNDYEIYHSVQSRQGNSFHIEIDFAQKDSKSVAPFIAVSVLIDSKFVIHDVSVVLNAQQAAASAMHDDAAFAALEDRTALQRLVLKNFTMYENFKDIFEHAISNKLDLATHQNIVATLYANLIEDYSVDIHEALAFVAEAVENFAMWSLLPRNDGMPGFDLTKYRVSCEKIHNINVDTSVATYDADGELEVPETFVRFESIRKRELQQYMLNKLAFITTAELESRFDDENMLHWLD